MSGFLSSIAAELRKTFSTRLWWVLALIMFVYVGAMSAGFAAVIGLGVESTGLDSLQIAPLVYSLASTLGYVFPVLLGALAVTTEYRFKSLTPTFLAQPRRGVVLGGKVVMAVLLGALFGVIGLLASTGVGAALLAVFGLDPELGDTDTWAMLGRLVLAMALWGAIGVCLGVLVPSQIGAIIIVLAFTQFVEPTLRAVVMFADWAAEVGRFLPGAAGDALVGASVFTAMSGMTEAAPLDWWQGALVLAGYAAVFGVAGWLLSWRRDVT